jgi:hypothetical protein
MPSSTTIALALIVAGLCGPLSAASQSPPTPPMPPASPKPIPQTPEQLQQLVAPIALYPDPLIAQVLAASTYPAEDVAAARWIEAHPDLKGDQLADSVNAQSWDPSVKALTQFPAVLTNLDTNIVWTSSLGEAYVNQQADVMDAIQTMRQRAEQAGKLKSDSQVSVTTKSDTVYIQPTNPQVIYVPAYDPWTFYGAPVAVYPGWVPLPGIFWGGPYFSWGIGFGIGFGAGFGWGWGHWGVGWGGRNVIYNNNRYVSRSTTFINRRTVVNRTRVNVARGSGGGGRDAGGGRGEAANRPTARNVSQPHNAGGGMRSSAFSGFNHGGSTAGFSARGRSSFGGGGFRGGGGFHGGGGGGFHGGGGRR